MNLHSANESQKNNDLIGLIVHAYNNHIAAIAGFNELALLHNSQVKCEELLELSLKSTKDAVYLGQTLVASVSRLQIETEKVVLAELEQSLLKLHPSLEIDLYHFYDLGIDSHREWLIDSFEEMFKFMIQLSATQNKPVDIKVSCQQGGKANQIKLIIHSNFSELEKHHQDSLFEIYYSSKMMFGQSGVGLAKVFGFFQQTNASVEWLNGKGFIIVLTTSE